MSNIIPQFDLIPFLHYHEAYLQWLNDPDINRYTSRGVHAVSEAEAREYVRTCQRPDQIVWGIHVGGFFGIDGVLQTQIGNVTLKNIDRQNRSAELAILIGELKFLGKGFGLAASYRALNHGFNQLGLNRIYCGTHEENIGMQKLAEKLGMKEEGRSRQALYKNGRFADIVHYGLLREEFKEA